AVAVGVELIGVGDGEAVVAQVAAPVVVEVGLVGVGQRGAVVAGVPHQVPVHVGLIGVGGVGAVVAAVAQAVMVEVGLGGVGDVGAVVALVLEAVAVAVGAGGVVDRVARGDRLLGERAAVTAGAQDAAVAERGEGVEAGEEAVGHQRAAHAPLVVLGVVERV